MSIVKGLFGIFNSAVKGASSGLKHTRGGWGQFEDLKNTPYLYGSDHIRALLKKAGNDPDKLSLIREYLERHGASDIGGYKTILRNVDMKLHPPKSDSEKIREMYDWFNSQKPTSMSDFIDKLSDYI